MKTNVRFIFITCHSILFRMRNVSDKSCRENQNTHFVFRTLGPFFSQNIVVYVIKREKKKVELDRPQMII